MHRILVVAITIAAALASAQIAQAGDSDAKGWREMSNGWFMTDKVSSVGGCGARLSGEQVDTLLTIDKSNQVILMVGKPNWKIEPGEHQVALQIDNNPPKTVVVRTLPNLVMTQIQDAATEQQLKTATMLLWSFPKGTYHAMVHDVGPIVDALRACNRKQHSN